MQATGDSDAECQMRSTAVSQVLGTDMKKHFDITSRFQVRVTQSAVIKFACSDFLPHQSWHHVDFRMYTFLGLNCEGYGIIMHCHLSVSHFSVP